MFQSKILEKTICLTGIDADAKLISITYRENVLLSGWKDVKDFLG